MKQHPPAPPEQAPGMWREQVGRRYPFKENRSNSAEQALDILAFCGWQFPLSFLLFFFFPQQFPELCLSALEDCCTTLAFGCSNPSDHSPAAALTFLLEAHAARRIGNKGNRCLLISPLYWLARAGPSSWDAEPHAPFCSPSWHGNNLQPKSNKHKIEAVTVINSAFPYQASPEKKKNCQKPLSCFALPSTSMHCWGALMQKKKSESRCKEWLHQKGPGKAADTSSKGKFWQRKCYTWDWAQLTWKLCNN